MSQYPLVISQLGLVSDYSVSTVSVLDWGE